MKVGKRNQAQWLLRRFPVVSAVLMAAIAIAFFVYVSVFYRADASAKSALISDDVEVVRTGYGWFFDGPSEDTALLFYPGGKVEETAYAPLLHRLAAAGMDACLVKMPFRLAVLNRNAAGSVMKQYSYSSWYIGGHSLGGVMAADYAVRHEDVFDGLILFASYPTSRIPSGMTEILLVGSEDSVIRWDRIEEARRYAPLRYIEHVIQGGNHAQFGSYGSQKGDGTAAISADLQIKESVETIMENLKR